LLEKQQRISSPVSYKFAAVKTKNFCKKKLANGMFWKETFTIFFFCCCLTLSSLMSSDGGSVGVVYISRSVSIYI
jgi:hypothetical protein